MRKQILFTAVSVLCLSGLTTKAQRYQTEIFTNSQIETISDIQYGTNMSILTGTPTASNLLLDVYKPKSANDTETNRPLVIVLHSGNFLPPVINGSPTGTRKDSSIVEACRMFARRGYVAASVSYRLGWNPISTDEDVRRGTLLQAVYRAILDTKTSIRFMRKEHATNSNPYGIDPTKIAIYGQGTGGYVALATGYLDKQAEIELSKFISQISNPPLFVQGGSYVQTSFLGNFDGSGGIPTFNNYEHAGYSNDVEMVMNVGGALADSSWINAGEPAVASVHTIRDPFAPFNSGIVVVPTTQENVVEVQGANVFILNANSKGLNDAFVNTSFFGDNYTERARQLYNRTYDYDLINAGGTVSIGNAEGLFAIDLASRTSINRFANQGSPWDWWSKPVLDATVNFINNSTNPPGTYNSDQIHGGGLLSNPDMSPAKGRIYLDTIINYFSPRMMRVMQIGNWEALSVNENISNNKLSVYPNPANGNVNITLGNVTMNTIQIFDISGKLVKSVSNAGNNFTFNTNELNNGLYLVRVQTENSVEISRLIVK